MNVAEDDADDPDDDVRLLVDMAGIENRSVCCKPHVKNGWRSYSPMELQLQTCKANTEGVNEGLKLSGCHNFLQTSNFDA